MRNRQMLYPSDDPIAMAIHQQLNPVVVHHIYTAEKLISTWRDQAREVMADWQRAYNLESNDHRDWPCTILALSPSDLAEDVAISRLFPECFWVRFCDHNHWDVPSEPTPLCPVCNSEMIGHVYLWDAVQVKAQLAGSTGADHVREMCDKYGVDWAVMTDE